MPAPQREWFRDERILVPGVRLMGWDLISCAEAGGLAAHHHPGAWELLYLVRGRVDWEVNGERFSSRGGEWNLVPPDTPHGGASGVLHTCEMYWFSVDLAAGDAAWRMLDAGLRSVHRRHFPADPGVGAIFARLWQEHRVPDAAALIAARALLDQLLVQCLRDARADRPADPSPAIAKAMALLDAAMAAPPRMETVARTVGLGPARFHALFLAEVGCTPGDHLMRQRIARAQGMLRAGALINDVARAVGFATRAHFSNAFRRYTGEPPAAWLASRAQHP